MWPMKSLIFLLISLLLLPSPALAATDEDDQFLDTVQKNAFMYFIGECSRSGIIQDRMTNKDLSSTLTEGYHLTALCVGAERNWISREDAAFRALTMLQTYDKLPKFHGIFAHYYDIRTGEVIPLMHKTDDGADLSETGFMMGGVLVCRAYFDRNNATEKKIRELATKLYESIEWDWMLQDEAGNIHKTLSWMWSPNFGFKQGQRIKSNMELSSMITYLLAIGSPSHPIPADSWNQGWASNYRWGTYAGHTFIVCPPMFSHQYAQTWLDFRNKKDLFANYFRNSTYAARANREYCLNTLYPGKDLWGLTFCDGPKGYGLYGYPPKVGTVDEDATIAPTAAAGSIVFTPKESISTLKYMYANFKDKLWGKYGFYDSFSAKHDWFDKDYIGLDQGPIVAMIENYRTGMVWKYFMKNEYVRNALDKAGFVGVIDDFEESRDVAPYCEWGTITDGTLGKPAVFSVINSFAKEGKSCLKVTGNGHISAKPLTPAVDGYRYLSLWLYGSSKLAVSANFKDGSFRNLNELSNLQNSDGWNHLYFDLSKDSLKEFDSLIFNFSGISGNQGVLMDAVFLTNILDTEKPSDVAGFNAVNLANPGEVKLSWLPPGNNNGLPLRYIVKRSHKPFLSNDDFKAAEEVKNRFTPIIFGSEKSVSVAGLPSGKHAYFAIKAEDAAGNLSDKFASCGVAVGASVMASSVIDDFEEDRVSAGRSEWYPSAKCLTLEKATDKAHDGRGSLKITYNKQGVEDAWAHIVVKTAFGDFSSGKSITLWVYGKSDILAKLYNSEDSQQDIATLSAARENGWSKLVFDISKLNNVDKTLVTKILFFIQPGKTDCTGTLYFDSLQLANQ